LPGPPGPGPESRKHSRPERPTHRRWTTNVSPLLGLFHGFDYATGGSRHRQRMFRASGPVSTKAKMWVRTRVFNPGANQYTLWIRRQWFEPAQRPARRCVPMKLSTVFSTNERYANRIVPGYSSLAEHTRPDPNDRHRPWIGAHSAFDQGVEPTGFLEGAFSGRCRRRRADRRVRAQ